jgi:hypothetical protein
MEDVKTKLAQKKIISIQPQDSEEQLIKPMHAFWSNSSLTRSAQRISFYSLTYTILFLFGSSPPSPVIPHSPCLLAPISPIAISIGSLPSRPPPSRSRHQLPEPPAPPPSPQRARHRKPRTNPFLLSPPPHFLHSFLVFIPPVPGNFTALLRSRVLRSDLASSPREEQGQFCAQVPQS